MTHQHPCNRGVKRRLLAEFGPQHPSITKESRVMNFAIRNLSVLAYTQGFTLWHYRAGSTPLGKVAEAGFFNDAADMFDTGDMILVSAAEAGRVLFVTGTEGGVVTAPLT
jgi:hypothetical protein